MATNEGIDGEDVRLNFIPRAPPPSPELPLKSSEPYFDFSSINFADNQSEPTSPTSISRYSPPSSSTLDSSRIFSKLIDLHPTSPPHDIPHCGTNGFTNHHHHSVEQTSYSVPNAHFGDYCNFNYASATQLFGTEQRQRKISLKRNHDDLSDDLCYSSSCDPSWLLVDPVEEGGHKKACQEVTLGSSPQKHKKLSVPSHPYTFNQSGPPLVTRLDQMSLHPQNHLSNHKTALANEEQLMDCSSGPVNAVVIVTTDSSAMDCSSSELNPFLSTAPASTHLSSTSTRSHTFSFSPSSNSSHLHPHYNYPNAAEVLPSSHHTNTFCSSFHEQTGPVPDGASLLNLSRSL